MNNNLNSKQWIIYLFLSLTLLIISFIGVNYIIDPYGYNNSIAIEQLNKNKTQTEAQSRKFKIALAQQQKFNALFLGSSEMTFLGNTEYASRLTGLKFFNLAFNEQEIYESLEYLKYIISQREIKYVILGLHPFKFNKHNTDYRQDTPKNIINGKGNLETYLSHNTLIDSLKTLYKNYNNFPLIHNENGWKIVDRLEYYKIPKEEHNQWLKEKVEESPQSLANKAKKFSLDLTKMNYLYEIVNLCQINNIKMKILFTPMYYKHYFSIYQNMNQDMNQIKYLVSQKAPFYDFSTTNFITLNYTNFLDKVSHSRQKVSYPMIDILFENKKHKDFGYYVTKENITNFLQFRKNELKKYH